MAPRRHWKREYNRFHSPGGAGSVAPIRDCPSFRISHRLAWIERKCGEPAGIFEEWDRIEVAYRGFLEP